MSAGHLTTVLPFDESTSPKNLYFPSNLRSRDLWRATRHKRHSEDPLYHTGPWLLKSGPCGDCGLSLCRIRLLHCAIHTRYVALPSVTAHIKDRQKIRQSVEWCCMHVAYVITASSSFCGNFSYISMSQIISIIQVRNAILQFLQFSRTVELTENCIIRTKLCSHGWAIKLHG